MRSPSPYKKRDGVPAVGSAYSERYHRFGDRRPERTARNGPPPQPPLQRERSLSPYSKRVAMTRAMQAGR